MTTGFVACLCQLPDNRTFHREVGTWNLNESRGNGRHDKSKEQRVAFLTTRMKISHEGWLVDTWCKRVDEVKEESNNQGDGIARCDFLQSMCPVIVRKRRDRVLWLSRQLLLVRPVIQWVGAERFCLWGRVNLRIFGLGRGMRV